MRNLYVVATPIGNLQDITIRAAKTLLEVPFVIAESTSKAGILFDFLKKEFPKFKYSHKQIISFTEDEEEIKIASIFQKVDVNDAALISEAGTPLISDPGFKLVREAIKGGVQVTPIPGPSSTVAALSVSGLPTNKFLFLGYLPKKDGKRSEVLENLKKTQAIMSTTAIILESPHRLVDGLVSIKKIFGDINIVIARELTKIHEEIRREKVSESIRYFEKNIPRGEFVILFSTKSF